MLGVDNKVEYELYGATQPFFTTGTADFPPPKVNLEWFPDNRFPIPMFCICIARETQRLVVVNQENYVASNEHHQHT